MGNMRLNMNYNKKAVSKNKSVRILVTGASSYVGARIYSDLNQRYKKYKSVTGTYKTHKLFPELIPLDITDEKKVAQLRSIRPEVIVHVAAVPSAAWCENNRELAKKINAEGTRNIVRLANECGAKVIYISSFAAIKPADLYGQTKQDGETFVKQAESGYVILRPSLIIGQSPNTKNDRPHNRMLKNILEKTPAIYDTSWKFQPTWLGHLSECVVSVIEKNITNETIPIAVPELKSRYDIAKDILSEFSVDVQLVDKKDKSRVFKEDLYKLHELNLPEYSYAQIIKKIVKEMKAFIVKNKKHKNKNQY